MVHSVAVHATTHYYPLCVSCIVDDCQQIYIRLQRKKMGYYTVDEDVKIIRAVLDFLKMPGMY